MERFYRRAGHLLCLMYVSSSTDFHDENLVACGEFPVPIDLETVFNPEPFDAGESRRPQSIAVLRFGARDRHGAELG